MKLYDWLWYHVLLWCPAQLFWPKTYFIFNYLVEISTNRHDFDGAGSFTCECGEAYKGQTCADSKKLISEVTVEIELGGITGASFASMDQDAVRSALENDVETFYSDNEDFLGVSGTTLTHSEDDSRVDISYQTSSGTRCSPG